MKRSKIKIVLFGIIFLIAGLIWIPRIIAPFEKNPPSSRYILLLSQLAYLKTALAQFELDNGYYPPGTNGLQTLLLSPPGTTNWRGPYVVDKEAINDPWGREYVYKCPAQQTNKPYDLFSISVDREVYSIP